MPPGVGDHRKMTLRRFENVRLDEVISVNSRNLKMWPLIAMSYVYLFLAEASFLDGVTVEAPSSLDELRLAVTSTPPSSDSVSVASLEVPSTPSLGLFDNIAIESPIPDETNPVVDGMSTTTPVMDAPRISNEQGQSGVHQDYTGLLVALVIIVGLLLGVGLLQLWMLRKIALGLPLERATDLEQGYQHDKKDGYESHAEVVMGQ